MLSDPISDMLTRVRNALGARQSKVEVPASRLKIEIVRILKEEGYIANYRVADEDGKRTIKIYLKYQPDHTPVISSLERVSKPGRRVYAGSKGIPQIIGGMGINIVTTSHGVMTDKQARKAGVGGEILCCIY
jgi:small subunit ribosomal protein S8